MSGELKLALGCTFGAGAVLLLGVLICFLLTCFGRKLAMGRLVGAARGSLRKLADKDSGELELGEECFPARAIIEFDTESGTKRVESLLIYDEEDFKRFFKTGRDIPVRYAKKDPEHQYSIKGEFSRRAKPTILGVILLTAAIMAAEIFSYVYRGSFK